MAVFRTSQKIYQGHSTEECLRLDLMLLQRHFDLRVDDTVSLRINHSGLVRSILCPL